MINPIIRDQLSKLKIAEIDNLNDDTYTYIITPKKKLTGVELDKCYLIQLAEYLVKPFEGFTLHQNWNNNIIPKDILMKCCVTQIMGKMIKIVGVGVDPNTMQDTPNRWEGWLPLKSIEVLKEI